MQRLAETSAASHQPRVRSEEKAYQKPVTAHSIVLIGTQINIIQKKSALKLLDLFEDPLWVISRGQVGKITRDVQQEPKVHSLLTLLLPGSPPSRPSVPPVWTPGPGSCHCERERERKKDIYTPQRTIYSINLIQSLNQQSPCYLCGCKSSLAICWCLFDSGEGRDTYRCGYLTVCLSDVRDGIAFIYMDVWVWNR